MGNSASSQPDDTVGDILPGDIFDLNDSQFQCLWHEYPLTVEQVTQAARSIPKKSQAERSLTGLYSQEEESREAALAVRLCPLLPELATLRFRLVPSRLKEDRFWEATFILLKERLVEYNAARQYEDEPDTLVEENVNGDHNETNEASNNQDSSKPPVNSNANKKGPSGDLARLLKTKNARIAHLEQQVKELQDALAAVNGGDSNNKKIRKKHKGPWKMEKDSQEFLGYPDEVKESLRKEKQRRLQQVKDEMKFILDSDDVQHTNGEWECCGERKFHAACSM